jgi:hypothetical protein
LEIDMRRNTHVLAAAAAALLLTGSAGAALAQPAPPPGAGHGPPSAEKMREHREARLKQIHDLLQLRPDQEAAWTTYVAALQPPPRPAERPDVAALTTPQRLDLMAERMAEGQTRFQRFADATKRFYGQLSPAQQKAFDAADKGRGHGPGMMGHGTKGHGMKGPGGR